MQHMSDHEKRDSPVMQESCPIYGVYSPVGRCGKTTFSLLLGELLARKRSVLYIGFDELPFWDEEENASEEQGEKGTLSDAYFYWQRQKLKEKLPVLVSHWHGVDVLTGMNCPEDLCAIQPEEWSQLILKIAQETEYAAIVLDIGSKLWLADSIFLMCSQLYVQEYQQRPMRNSTNHTFLIILRILSKYRSLIYRYYSILKLTTNCRETPILLTK